MSSNLPFIAAEILIVDDQPDNIRTLAAILRQHGYQVRKSLNGQSALASARSFPPDLILLDIRMPVMDGYAVCAALKQDPTTAQIPVIFLSALSEVSDKAQGFAIGAVDYITKPFQTEEVLVRIQHQLLLRQQQAELARLNQQLQQCNWVLEEKVQARTQSLQESLTFEATLKRISDHVRDSLNSQEILQAALAELDQVLTLKRCHASLYANGQVIAHLYAQAEQHPDYTALASVLDVLPGVQAQLAAGEAFAFCLLPRRETETGLAILAGPIFDDRREYKGITGTLWLLREAEASFNDSEVRLVQQVANQCAIALRQARLYEAAQQQVQELQRLNQLKDDFLSTVSHELRSPLATINLAADLIPTLLNQMIEPKTIPGDSKLCRYLTMLKEACHRELRLVDDLLTLQTLEAGNYTLQITPLKLSQWLPMILESAQALAASQQQTLTLRIPPDLPILDTDSASLKRIMTELVHNACKYTPHGGAITVSASVQVCAGEAAKRCSCEKAGQTGHLAVGQTLQIMVHNTGSHIPATEYDRIFEKFYRIPHRDPWKHGGTGLGLALVKKLVESLGAAIAVSSDEQGTCFRILFTLATGNGANVEANTVRPVSS